MANILSCQESQRPTYFEELGTRVPWHGNILRFEIDFFDWSKTWFVYLGLISFRRAGWPSKFRAKDYLFGAIRALTNNLAKRDVF